MMLRLLLLLPGCSFIVSVSAACSFQPGNLRVNNLVNPIGTPSATPFFSWSLTDTSGGVARGQVQSAYRIRCSSTAAVASSGEVAVADLWDSGQVSSSETLQIPYGGRALASAQKVYWTVSVWDGSSSLCPAAQDSPAFFETALLDEAAWQGAEWIARYEGRPNATGCELYALTERNQAPRFRYETGAAAAADGIVTVVNARAYISGLGYYQLYIDGTRVGTSRLDPGWTTYDKTVLYAVHDVTAMVNRSGSHVVGVELGNGWWNPLPLLFWGHDNLRTGLTELQGRNASEPMFRLLIRATMSDGTQRVLASTARAHLSGWRAGGSPTTFNNIYLGEKYDARMAASAAGWAGGQDANQFGGAGWTEPVVASTAAATLGPLIAQSVPPIRRQGSITPTVVKPLRETGPFSAENTTTILDTGRNHAGSCRFRFSGRAGDVVSLRYGELLHADGTLNPYTSTAGQIKGPNSKEPCQPALGFQGDVMTLSGRGMDEWAPSWSWHGYRYIEVTVPLGVTLGPDSIECYPMRTDVATVANFSSSDPFLDELRTLVRNTFDSNMMSVQSDCPHRERFGYGGDPLGCGEAGLSIYDWSTFYRKRVIDFNDAQRVFPNGSLSGFTETSPFVGITDAGLVPGGGTGPIGWETYQPETQLWLYKYYGDTETMRQSFNSTYAYIQLLDSNPPGIGHGLGEWMPVVGTSTEFTGPAFLRMSYLAFANITQILGKAELSKVYRQKALDVEKQINALFLDTTTGSYGASRGLSATVGSIRGRSLTTARHTAADSSGTGEVVVTTGERPPAKPFCGESGLNPAPNPGDEAYQTLSLSCTSSPGDSITAIDFAQWGVPGGGPACNSWTAGDPCGKEQLTEAYVRKLCMGKSSCVLDPRPALGDTCPNKHKTFVVRAACQKGAGHAVAKRGGGGQPSPAPPPAQPKHATQTGQGLALFMDIVPKSLRQKALSVLIDDVRRAGNFSGACQGGDNKGPPGSCKAAKGGPGPHMTAGLFGIKWFLMALADNEHNDLAYDVLTTPTYPGFKWMMNNEFDNATTIWESWFFSDNTFSHNHPMFGSSEVWLLQSVGGIQPHPAAKGMDKILIKPAPPTQLQHASASFSTPRGTITTSWRRETGGKLVLNCTIPPNVKATVHVPSRVGTDVTEGVETLDGGQHVGIGRTARAFEVGSGSYSFRSFV